MARHLTLILALLVVACTATRPEATREAASDTICTKETPTGSNRPQLRCHSQDNRYRTQQAGKAATEQMTRTRGQTPMAD